MRMNLEQRPVIEAKDQDEFKKLLNFFSGKTNTLLSEDEFKKSVSNAKKIMEETPFEIRR